MSKREELRKQWAEYDRRLDEVKETAPEDAVLEMDSEMGSGKVRAFYSVEDDDLEITRRYSDGAMRVIALSGDEAEKLYHFLGGLYG
jgi:hypothetical protein